MRYSANKSQGSVYVVNGAVADYTVTTDFVEDFTVFNVKSGEDCSAVIAIPDTESGYSFDKWSDGVTTAARQDTNIATNINVQAIFKKEEYTLNYLISGQGRIEGETNQSVKRMEDGVKVVAVPDRGYRFVKWSDGVTTPERKETRVAEDMFIAAIFEKEEYTLYYYASEYGSIVGATIQSVKYLGEGTAVTAVPDKECEFVKWSDGVTTAMRLDSVVTENITVSAIFKKEYTLNYSASEHGSIDGETRQTVDYLENGVKVTAVPDKGYKFVKWSDGVTTSERREMRVKENVSVTAEFALLSREYELNERKTMGSEINKQKISLTYGTLGSVKLPVPEREHFVFGGWYYGEMKIADENGDFVVSDDFILDEAVIRERGRVQDICAKWEAEETFTYKILLVYVTRIQAELYDRYGQKHNIDYTMTDLQRQFCEATTMLAKQTMDELCDGLVDFQIDEYYTRQTITNSHLSQSGVGTATVETSLYPRDIPEIKGMMGDYGTILTVYGFGGDAPTNESAHLFQHASGAGGLLGGEIFLDSMIYNVMSECFTLTDVLNGKNKENWINYPINSLIHETAHTIESRIHAYSYHKAVVSNGFKYKVNAARLDSYYYTQAIEEGDKLVGIPYEFWKGDVAKVVYESTKYKNGNMGYVYGSEYYEFGGSDAIQEVPYGWDALGVIAKPYSGYRFVRWSDGVTTPERKDRNVTSDFTVTAIFEPITYTLRIVAGEGGGVRARGSIETQDEIDVYAHMYEWSYVEAVAQDGYRFVGWSDGTTNINWSKFIQSIDLDLFDEDDICYLTAVFEKIEEID